MSLSDCPKCWNTPCTCGHMFKSWSPKRLKEYISMLQDTLVEVEKSIKINTSANAELKIGDIVIMKNIVISNYTCPILDIRDGESEKEYLCFWSESDGVFLFWLAKDKLIPTGEWRDVANDKYYQEVKAGYYNVNPR
jgi:hypothetical protein